MKVIISLGDLANNQKIVNKLKRRLPLDQEILPLLADINAIFSLFASQDDQKFINEWEKDVFILNENFLPKRDGVNASTYCLQQLAAHIFSPEQLALAEAGESGQWLKNIRKKAEEIIHDVTCELNEEDRPIGVRQPIIFSTKKIKTVESGANIASACRNETASDGIIKNRLALSYYDFFRETSLFYTKISESSLNQFFNIVRLESLPKVIAFRKILKAQDGDVAQSQEKFLKEKSVEQFLHLFYYTYVREEIDEKLGLASDEKEVFLFLLNLLTIIGDEGLKEYFASQQGKTVFGGNVMELENACASPKENLRNWFRVSMPGTDPVIAEKELIENLLDWAKDLIRRELKSVCWEMRNDSLDCFGAVMFLRKEYAA